MNRFFLVCFLFITLFVQGQKNIANQFTGWGVHMGNFNLNKKWGLLTEYQWRRSNGFENWQQSLTRVGVEYGLNRKWSVMLGYAWVRTYPYGSQPVLHEFDEHRLFQQVNLKDKIGRMGVQHRYRLEQRQLGQYAKDMNGEVFKTDPVFRQRIRYRLMITVPLNKREMGPGTLFLNLNNEIFLGFGSGIAKNPLDQNRFQSNLGWQFNDQLNVQVGYLNQFIIKANAIDFERNHTLWFGVFYNLSFKN